MNTKRSDRCRLSLLSRRLQRQSVVLPLVVFAVACLASFGCDGGSGSLSGEEVQWTADRFCSDWAYAWRTRSGGDNGPGLEVVRGKMWGYSLSPEESPESADAVVVEVSEGMKPDAVLGLGTLVRVCRKGTVEELIADLPDGGVEGVFVFDLGTLNVGGFCGDVVTEGYVNGDPNPSLLPWLVKGSPDSQGDYVFYNNEQAALPSESNIVAPLVLTWGELKLVLAAIGVPKSLPPDTEDKSWRNDCLSGMRQVLGDRVILPPACSADGNSVACE